MANDTQISGGRLVIACRRRRRNGVFRTTFRHRWPESSHHGSGEDHRRRTMRRGLCMFCAYLGKHHQAAVDVTLILPLNAAATLPARQLWLRSLVRRLALKDLVFRSRLSSLQLQSSPSSSLLESPVGVTMLPCPRPAYPTSGEVTTPSHVLSRRRGSHIPAAKPKTQNPHRGMVHPAKTPEGQAAAGLVKNMAMMAYITTGTSRPGPGTMNIKNCPVHNMYKVDFEG